MQSNAFIDRYARVFGRPQATLLQFAGLSEGEVRAKGAEVEGAGGRRWLDFGSFGMHLLGHRHDAILAAAHKSIDEMGLSTKILGNCAATGFVENLISRLPWNMDSVILGNTGCEAVESALKLAMIATGRRLIVSLENGYHGKSLAIASLGGGHLTEKLPPLIECRKIRAEDYDGLDRLLQSEEIAAVIVEPIQGEGGILAIPPPFLRHIGDRCHATGTMLILDEIQTGIGRTGRPWAGEISDFAPDIVVFGKVLGGGLVPISATAFRKKQVGSGAMDPIVHSSSFAGGTFATTVATAALETALAPNFLDRVTQLGDKALSSLQAVATSASFPAQARGAGLMIGLEVDSAERAGLIVMEAAKRGLLLTFCLTAPTVVRIYPPGVVSDEQLDQGLETITEALGATS
ncbi:aspartate aminotransferase family protein [Erythrobacter sp.]|uniref:class-III pyridoxal-phosphate-dependent aminotransferase n=1 Tax=Erythrobacter sp. TaxID=1042 RepID=UPI003C707B3F